MLQHVSPPPSAQTLSGSTPSLDGIRIADLPNLGRDTIHDLWRRLHRKPPPKGLTGDLLVRALAYSIQIERHGGLSRGAQQRQATAARQAMQERARAGQDDHQNAGTSAPSRTLRPGTRLVREWQGEVHEVIALADGFLWNGASYRSLSVIAKAVTGTVWNGWIFFGVERKKPRRRATATSIPGEDPLKQASSATPAALAATPERPKPPPRRRSVRNEPISPILAAMSAETPSDPISIQPTRSRARSVPLAQVNSIQPGGY